MEIIYVLITGFTSAYLAKALDDWMDRGAILDFLRIWAAKRYSKGFSEVIPTMENESYFDRQELYRQSYWQIAKDNKSFTPWVCVDCMSVRILILFILIGLFILPVQFLVFTPLAFAANRFFIGLKIS